MAQTRRPRGAAGSRGTAQRRARTDPSTIRRAQADLLAGLLPVLLTGDAYRRLARHHGLDRGAVDRAVDLLASSGLAHVRISGPVLRVSAETPAEERARVAREWRAARRRHGAAGGGS